MKIRQVPILLFAISSLLFGAVHAQEKRVKMKDLPEAVQKTVKEQGKDAALKGLSRDKLEKYEALVKTSGKKSEIQVDPDGNLIPKAKH